MDIVLLKIVMKEILLHLVDINFDLCNILPDVNAVQERVMVVTVLIAESPQTAIVGALWPTIVPVFGLLTILVPFKIGCCKFYTYVCSYHVS